ncbi:MAG TPA: hypothetical protein VFC46_06750 [Humisphaera sp.]|nr:hypothetical protein [Humisphaera sp.]
MRKKNVAETFAELERLAHKTDDIRVMSAAMRNQWEAAKRTGAKVRRGRPRKDPNEKSLIVPISIEPALLEAIDKFAKAVGVTRSRLVAEGLRLRMKA